jgi:hypothetical protein
MESKASPTETEMQNRIKGSPLVKFAHFPSAPPPLHRLLTSITPSTPAALLCSITFVVLLLFLFRRVTVVVAGEEDDQRRMSDWGPVVIAVVLFVLLSPGLLIVTPALERIWTRQGDGNFESGMRGASEDESRTRG